VRIICYPDPVLIRPSTDVDEINGALVQVCRDMFRTMYEGAGIGLAGPQIGMHRRIVVVNLAGGAPEGEMALVNPVITAREDLLEGEEGCLSFPGLYGKVARSARVQVRAYDLDGHEVSFEAEGFPARVWQHEIDHLDGVLLIERMSPAHRLAAARRLRELEYDYEKR
jgi:peptide deformylase